MRLHPGNIIRELNDSFCNRLPSLPSNSILAAAQHTSMQIEPERDYRNMNDLFGNYDLLIFRDKLINLSDE